jgi:hypothetical protein
VLQKGVKKSPAQLMVHVMGSSLSPVDFQTFHLFLFFTHLEIIMGFNRQFQCAS